MACYGYVPIGDRGLSPGNQVAVDLSTEGSAALAQLIGPTVTTIEGRLTSADSTGLTLAVTDTRLRDGRSYHWTGEPVHLGRGQFISVEIRRLSVARTGLLVAAGAAGIAAVVAAGAGTGTGHTGTSGGPPPPR